MIRLDARVAVVTGAGRGLGRSHALELARRGAKLLVNDTGGDLLGGARSHRIADAVVEEIRSAGGTAAASYHDAADPAAVESMIGQAVDTFGRIDVLVCNAGNLLHAPVTELSNERFDQVLRVHLYGTFHAVRAACALMRAAGWGRIVLTTSQVGFFGKAESAAYGTAKMGVLGLMASLALEMAPHGVLVNAVSPLAFTRMGEGAFPPELETHLDPAEVSAVVAYLASSACTGSGDIVVAGGGHFAVARMVESRGIYIDDRAELDAESVAARFEEIRDLDGAAPFSSAMDAVGPTFEKLRRRI